MLRLKFQAMQDAHSATVGPAERFRIAGNFMRQSTDEVVIAEYVRHQWQVQGGYYSRYDTLDPCRVWFADAEGARSSVFGPYEQLFVADGTMYAEGKLFAKFAEETVLWHSFELESYWPSLIIQAE